MPGVGVLNGTVWHDANFDDALDAGERALEGWTVELLPQRRAAAVGAHRRRRRLPHQRRARRTTRPAIATSCASARRARARTPRSSAAPTPPFTNGLQRITDIVVPSGSNLQNLNLPIDPNGVVYDSISAHAGRRRDADAAECGRRRAAAGDLLRRSGPAGPGHARDGYYKFDLNFSDPACPSGGSYLIAVTPPGAGFVAGYSQIIPPTSGAATAPFSVPTCPGSADDAVPATAAVLRGAALGVRAAAVGAAAHARARTTTCT